VSFCELKGLAHLPLNIPSIPKAKKKFCYFCVSGLRWQLRAVLHFCSVMVLAHLGILKWPHFLEYVFETLPELQVCLICRSAHGSYPNMNLKIWIWCWNCWITIKFSNLHQHSNHILKWMN